MSKIDVLHKLGVGRRDPFDPFFAEGDAVCKAYKREGIVEIDDEDLCHEVVAKFPCHVMGCMLEFDSLLQYELHYNSSHRYYCNECRKRLPSPHLLDLHVSESHDSFFLAQAQRQPMYRCYVEECKSVFATGQERRAHCIQDHQFPHDFRFDVSRKQETKHSKLTHNKESLMELDSCPGDKKCGIRVKRSKSKSNPIEPVAVLSQGSEQVGCGNIAKCEEGAMLGRAMCTNQSGEDMHTERFAKPFNFIRGHGRYQRLGGICKRLNSGMNKPERASDSNIWGTSSLLNALQDVETCSDGDCTRASGVVGDVRNEHEQLLHTMGTSET
ncbi:hypothetical protein Cfor_12452 [Coptotermes formosanus]|uniref:C2H2-type domain-containing protein n=1 Tax=Coptotermes formosanus TaxID=36987 RepID=A0A6L2Q021_COPFO|nr:hypothetical protein Cfor_12452 [Coptotermes formosanus]